MTERQPFSEIQPQPNTPSSATYHAIGKEWESSDLIPRLVSKIADLEQKLYASDIWGGEHPATLASFKTDVI